MPIPFDDAAAMNALLGVAIAIGRRVAKEEAEKVERGLWDYPEAAAFLGISVPALEKRVARNHVQGVVRTGRRVQFQVAVLKGMRISR